MTLLESTVLGGEQISKPKQCNDLQVTKTSNAVKITVAKK